MLVNTILKNCTAINYVTFMALSEVVIGTTHKLMVYSNNTGINRRGEKESALDNLTMIGQRIFF